MTLPILPEQPQVDPAGDYARAQAWAMLQARYADAGNYAVWAHQTLQVLTDELKNITNTDVVTAKLEELLAALTALPPTTIIYTDSGFSEPLLDALKNRIEADLATSNTGLDTAEAALFARHEARVAAERVKAYTEITTQFSSGGWDMPPGALLAKQTEMNNESSKRLADTSADVMTESARLAVEYNKTVLQEALGIVDLLGRLHDSKVMRDFEKAKTQVTLDLEALKVKASVLSDAARLELDAAMRESTNQVESLRGLSQGAMQMIASAMNSVSSSSSFDFKGSASTSYSTNNNTNTNTNN